MDSWLTYSDFKEKYPDSSLTEPQFTPMAIDAALFIENATRWCASIAAEPEQTELLALSPGPAGGPLRRGQRQLGRCDQRQQPRVH